MGILNRFKDIMSANINAILDKCENPEKMIDEYMRQVVEQLADVKKETAGVMAEEKRCKREVDENAEQIEEACTENCTLYINFRYTNQEIVKSYFNYATERK